MGLKIKFPKTVKIIQDNKLNKWIKGVFRGTNFNPKRKKLNYEEIAIQGLTIIIIFALIVYAYAFIKPYLNQESFWNFKVWLKEDESKVFTYTYFVIVFSLITYLLYRLLKYIQNKFNLKIIKTHLFKLNLPSIKTKLNLPKILWGQSRTKRFIYSLLLLTIVLPLVAFTLVNVNTAKASWWSDNWLYRKRVAVINTGSSQTDFQVIVTINTASLISSGKMQADCDDIRIVDSNLNLLSYWIEPTTNACNSATTDIWVKIPSISTSGESLYVYYGNTWATNISSGANTFIYFQDFSSYSNGTDITSVPNWTKDVDYSSTYTIQSNKLQMYHPASAPNGAFDGAIYTHSSELTTDTAIDADITVADSNNYDLIFAAYDATGSYISHTSSALWTSINNEAWQMRDSSTWTTAESGLSVGTTYRLSGGVIISSDTQKSYLNGTYKIDKTFPDTGTTGIQSIYFGNYGYGSTNTTWYADNIRLRKFSTSVTSTLSSTEEYAYGLPSAYWKFDEGYNSTLEQPLKVNEQQINILDHGFYMEQNYDAVNDSVPLDDSLGIIHWDENKFPGATVYFEAVLKRGTYIQSANAALYETGGSLTAVSGSTITTSSTSYTRVRSSSITLTDDTDYTVRTFSDASANGIGNTFLLAARLVVVQSDSSQINSTETYIEVGNSSGTSSATFANLTDKKIYYYDSSKFNPAPTAYFEAAFKPYSPKIEQQINIIDQVYTIASTSYAPTDNSLGIIHWDDDKYTGETVYFEADLDATSSGTCTPGEEANAALYTTSNQQISASILTAYKGYTGSYDRSRSGALSLSDDTDYTVRVSASTGCAANIKAARLIIVQSDSTKITDTETAIEVGNSQNDFSNGSYSTLTNPKIYYYDSSKFSGTVNAYFEATIHTDGSGDTVYAQLLECTSSSDCSTGTPVSGSEVSHTGDTNWALTSRASVTLSTTKNYAVQVKMSGGTGDIANAKIIINQTAVGGITDVEVVHQQINTLTTLTSSTPTDQLYISDYNQANFGTVPVIYYETTMKTDTGGGASDAFSQLSKPVSGSTSTTISNTTISTSNTSYTRVRNSSDLYNDLPFSTRDFDAQIYNEASATTSVSNSWLVIQFSNIPTSGTAGAIELYNKTDSTSVSGSELTSSNGNYSLVRTNLINLTTGKEYEVRFKQAVLSSARIVLTQSDSPSGIKAVETVQQMINTISTQATSSYTSKNFLNQYNPSNNHYLANYNDAAIYFEATMKTSVGDGTKDAFAQLYGASAITGSEVTTQNTSYTRVRTSQSIANNMPTSATNMDTQIKNEATETTSASSSWMIIQNNDTLSTATHDSSANASHAKIQSASWKRGADCSLNNCLNFNGTSDYLKVKDSANLNFLGPESFTISAWFKTSTTPSSEGVILAKYNAATGTDGGYKLYINSFGQVVFGIDDDQTSFPEDSAVSTSSYTDNVWHLATAVKTGNSDITLYIDGKQVAQDNTLSATGSLSNTDMLYIGIDGNGTSNFWAGNLDDIKIYPYARSINEIAIDFNKGTAVLGINNNPLNDGLVTYLAMDETTANTCSATDDNCDSSGLGNHAAWNDNASSISGKYSNALSLDGTSDRSVLSNTNGVQKNWYDSNWTKRKPITVTNNTASTLINYQVQLSITYDSDMQTDFDDIRFTNSDGASLDYWTESKSDSTSASVWVEVDTIPASSSSTIYMYYGYGSASSSSNINNTFLAADEFNGPSLDSEWTEVTAGGASAGTFSSGTWTKSCNGECDWWNNSDLDAGAHIAFPTISGSDTTWEAVTKITSTSGTGNREMGIMVYQGLRDGLLWHYYPGGSNFHALVTGGTGQCSISDTTIPSWLKIKKITANGVANNNDFTFWRSTDGTNWSQCGTYSATDIMSRVGIFIKDWTTGATGGTWDFFLVKKYASTEPTPSFGSEQTTSDITSAKNSTFSSWVNPSTLGTTNRVIMSGNNSGNYSWAIYNDSANPGKLKFTSDGVNFGLGTTTLSTSNWYHIAMVVEGTKTKLYVNGKLDGEVTNNGTLSGGTISVGADPDGTDGWSGKVDEVRIYNRALPSNEVTDLYSWEPGTIAYYNFDEGTGTTTVYDKAGNGNDLTINGGMTNANWINGQYGNALSFDGNNDSLSRVDDSDFDFTTTDSFTISTWFKHPTQTSGTDVIAAKYETSGADGGYKLLMESDGDITCGVDTDNSGFPLDSATTTAATYDDDTWHHVSCVKDSSTSLKIFIDGVLITTDSSLTGTGTYANDDPLYIAIDGDGSSNPWEGSLDDLRFYNYARTPENVTEDFNAGHPAPGSPIGSAVGYWKFDEGYGDTANNTGSGGSSINGDLGAGTSCPQSGDSTCPAWTNSGKFGKALDFSNSSTADYLSTNGSEILAAETQGSISMWIKSDDPNSTNATFSSVEGRDKIIFTQSSKFQAKIYDGTSCRNASGGTVDSAWHHVTFTWNSIDGDIAIYVDGLLADLKDGNSWTTASTESGTRYGGLSGGAHSCESGIGNWDGMLDEVQVFTSALTADQVKLLYNQGKAAVMGANSTNASGNASWSASDSYCPPGQGSSCTAPVAEYLLDEKTDIYANNTSGGDYKGTLTSNPSWQRADQCHVGACLQLNGSDQYVDVGTGPTSVKSVEFWVYPKTTTEYFLNLTSNTDYIWTNAGTVTATGFNTPTIYVDGKPSSTITANSWHHIVVTTETAENASNLDLGRTQDTNYLEGRIDQVRLYSNTLTQAQIAWLRNQGDPIAHWKFDECSGTSAYDASGNNLAGTIEPGDSSGDNDTVGTCSSNVTTEMWNDGTTGKRGASLGFDGTNDYVSITDNAAFNLYSTRDYSWSFWIKPSSFSGYQTIWSQTASSSNGIIIYSQTGVSSRTKVITIHWVNGWGTQELRTSSVNNAIDTDRFYHVVITYEASLDQSNRFKIYIDGKDQTNRNGGTSVGTIPDLSPDRIEIGDNSYNSEHFDGQIDEVKIYNYALTDKQVLTEHNGGAVKY